MGLLGIPNVLIAAVGNDFAEYRKHLAKIKQIDTSGVSVFKNELTARGFVTTDRDDNQIWGFYEGAMKLSKTISASQHLTKNTILVIAPNDPIATLKYVGEAIDARVSYVFDPAFNIPYFSRRDLKKAIQHSEILIGNDYEIQLIQERLKCTKSELVKLSGMLITTLGAKGSRIETSSSTITIPPAKPEDQSDPTGAGDAFRAGFLVGYACGLSLDICGRMGSIASVYTVEKYSTQTHLFTKSSFSRRYKSNFGKSLPG